VADRDAAPKPRPLFAPEFTARRRRQQFWLMLMCIAMGVGVVIDALHSIGHGGMVSNGPRGGYLSYPWWIVAPIGLFAIGLGVFGLVSNLRERD